MSESSEDLKPPSRQEVEAKLLDLIEGRCSPSEASGWAAYRRKLIDDHDLYRHVDERVWDALVVLSDADAISTDRPHLYDENDFIAWLKELRGEPAGN